LHTIIQKCWGIKTSDQDTGSTRGVNLLSGSRDRSNEKHCITAGTILGRPDAIAARPPPTILLSSLPTWCNIVQA